MDAYEDVRKERARQDRIHGGMRNDDLNTQFHWASFIVNKLGVAIQWPLDKNVFRRRMIQVAALAIAAVEALDRGAVSDGWQSNRDRGI